MSPEAREALLSALLVELQTCADGCSEHQLLKRLRTRQELPLPEGPLADPLVLFQSHWLVFHGLYELRDRLLSRGEALLHIDPLGIQLLPYDPGEIALAVHDPVREVYRDLSPLETTGAADVLALIGGFQARLQSARDYQQALTVLGLEAPVDLAAVRRQYRRLAMAYHPDRGGDARRFTALRAARETLERYLGA